MTEFNGKISFGKSSMNVVIVNAGGIDKTIHQTDNKSKCLDIAGYNLTDNYCENDNVIWFARHYKWSMILNQYWILECCPRKDPKYGPYYIKTRNRNLYLCYRENNTMFLSSTSQNKIILNK